MKKVLVGVDGSAESKRAAEFAAQLARTLKAQLNLVYVVESRAGERKLEKIGSRLRNSD